MFSMSEKLEDSLLDCLNSAIESTKSPLIFGHICWGQLSKPGALRMTKIIASQDDVSPLERKRRLNNIDHEHAFRRHIKRFGRSGTLLDWLTLWMYKHTTFQARKTSTSRINFNFLISQSDQNHSFISDDNSLHVTSLFLQALLPPSATEAYVTQLYAGQNPIDQEHSSPELFQFASEQMIGARSDAMKQIKTDTSCFDSLNKLSTIYETTDLPEEYRAWVFLGALQTGLMYVLYAGLEKIGFTSVGHCYNVDRNKNPSENPLVILSAVIGSPNLRYSDLQHLLEAVMNDHDVETSIREIAHYRDRPQRKDLARMKTNHWSADEVERILEPELSNAFQISAFPGWTSALMLWLSLAAEHLRDTVHEGQHLNFCFAVADKSQILDSGSFEVVDLVADTCQYLLPWEKDGKNELDIGTVLSTIERQIGKKNYSWFQDGKYALLWDATFPSSSPRSLIRLKDSSWDVYITNVRMNKKSKLHDLVGALAFVRGDGSGGVIIKGKQLLSFRQGQPWTEAGGSRETKLKSYLEKAFKNWALSAPVLEEILLVTTRALLAISDDSNVGCMLIILGKTEIPQFHCMGNPWCTEHGNDPLKMTLDEITSLMSMDGATCLYLTNSHPTIAFRRLAKPPNEILTEHQNLDLLDGEGSRKWNSYFAAARADVVMVLSVSQDGPINIFHKDSITGDIVVEKPF